MGRLAYLESKLKTRLVTCEMEILTFLFFHGPAKSQDLARNTKASIASFQTILRRFRENGVIVCKEDAIDRRMRIYELSEQARTEMEKAFRQDVHVGSIMTASYAA